MRCLPLVTLQYKMCSTRRAFFVYRIYLKRVFLISRTFSCAHLLFVLLKSYIRAAVLCPRLNNRTSHLLFPLVVSQQRFKGLLVNLITTSYVIIFFFGTHLDRV